jgi:hypothetical protein
MINNNDANDETHNICIKEKNYYVVPNTPLSPLCCCSPSGRLGQGNNTVLNFFPNEFETGRK